MKKRKPEVPPLHMERYWSWFCCIPGLTYAQRELLLKCFGNPEALWRASDRELSYLEEKGCAFLPTVKIFRKETPPEKTEHRIKSLGIEFTSCENPRYPGRLKNLSGMPFGLFWKGKIPEEERKTVAIVGARECTRFGKETAENLAGEIARAGGVVVSGAAYGVDGAAQLAALLAGGESTAVLGCGTDIRYPAGNGRLFELLERQGTLVSEYPPGTPPRRYHFPARNRIISGLSDVTVVVEARKRSGSLITAGFAADQGKDVYAVPGRPGECLSEGCNELISQGANLFLSAESFLRTFFPEKTRQKKWCKEDLTLAPAEKLVYSSFDLHSKTLWELAECTGLSLSELGSSLLSLEEKGYIRETGQNTFAAAAWPGSS